MADPIPNFRVNTNQSVAPQGLGPLVLTRGDSANLEVTMFQTGGTQLADISTLVDLTFEIYASSDGVTPVTVPLTLVAADLNPALTLEEWNEDGGYHALFELTSDQTNYAFDTRQVSVWGVISGTLPGGAQITFGAGTITIRKANAAWPVPADIADNYVTRSEFTSFMQAVNDLQDFPLPESAIPTIDAAYHGSRQILERITGLTANDLTKKIFSTATHTGTPAYVRSATCWAADCDLTALSPWNSATGTTIGLTAISPDLAAGCFHTLIPADGTVTARWITADGLIVDRVITARARVGATDLELYKLASILPASITPAKILPLDSDRFFYPRGNFGLYTDQEGKALVCGLNYSLGASNIGFGNPGVSPYSAFYETIISGDSGHAVTSIQDGKLVLLATIDSSSSGPIAGAANYSAIQTAASSIGGAAPTAYPFTQLAAPVQSVSGKTGDVSIVIEDLSDAGDDIKDFLRTESAADARMALGLGPFGANPDTSGATLGQLETEVNQLKALLRALDLMAT